MTDAQHTLYLWKIERTDLHNYDEYSDAVVVSKDVETAKGIHPSGDPRLVPTLEDYENGYSSWTIPKHIRATRIGTAAKELKEGQVLCASFHAG